MYCVLHLLQEYDFVPGINFRSSFLFFRCLDADLHFGQIFILGFFLVGSCNLLKIKSLSKVLFVLKINIEWVVKFNYCIFWIRFIITYPKYDKNDMFIFLIMSVLSVKGQAGY